MDKVIFIVGATSSGKSEVATALAEKKSGEIISSDSMQVYRGMDIISQAPGKELTSRVPHHLVRILPPEEDFNCARFCEKAREAIRDIMSRGRLPVIAGGTGLYIKALLDGIFPSPPKDEVLRRRLRMIARDKGNEYLYRELERIDPVTAGKLHPNDLRRVIRAIEVYELTGSTMNEKKSSSEGIASEHDCLLFGLELPRKVIYGRINVRVERMFREGLAEEVRELKKRQLSLTAEKALGIKELGAFLEGGLSLEKAGEELKKNTRRYAKRQLTWFRKDRRINWIDAQRPVEEIVGDIKQRMDQR
ncbi:MAG: tRNA (adenosine(37)-N6)-dimethylallyltransferase MiaA [Candidatus Omnitrophica bacterium]|nr:tRNA (adenosine(37)-N6)-dimethylallyltransferase MiaA [Candidatus Omnitrophota bacterium]